MEIEGMLTERSSQPADASEPGTIAAAKNTLDELMAELSSRSVGLDAPGTLERQLSRGNRSFRPTPPDGDGLLRSSPSSGSPPSRLQSRSAAPMPPTGPGLAALPTMSPLGALQSPQLSPLIPRQSSSGSIGGLSPLGPVRPQSPMANRRATVSGLGAIDVQHQGQPSSPRLLADGFVGEAAPLPGGPPHALPGPGPLSPLAPSRPQSPMPPSGVTDRQQAQLEARLDKLEAREQQLLQVIHVLQQQVSGLTRTVHHQDKARPATGTGSESPGPATPRHAPAWAADDKGPSSGGGSPGPGPGPAGSNLPRGPSLALQSKMGPPAEWEGDVEHLRKELGALAAGVGSLKARVEGLVPGGPAPLAAEVAGHAEAQSVLKQHITHLAGDVVTLQKSLQGLKQHFDKATHSLQQSVQEVSLQLRTSAVSSSAPAPQASSQYGSHSNGLEDSLRTTFSRPAMRALPSFRPEGSMDANYSSSGVAAAITAFGGVSSNGRGGLPQQQELQGGQGGINAAMAMLTGFEEQAAMEQQEQRHSAMVAKQAMVLVDAKVKQVVVHVDRHMSFIKEDFDERLRMYEKTIIRLAQQIDRITSKGVQDGIMPVRPSASGVLEPASAPSKDTRGLSRSSDGNTAALRAQNDEAADAANARRGNWIKASAASSGRFVPQIEEPREKPRNQYFAPP